MTAWMQGLKPAAGMVLVQAVFAGINIFYKVALNDGMDLRILTAYRYLFASLLLCPLAYFLERKKRTGLTWKILMQAFLSGTFGGALCQNLYVATIKMTTATYTAAMANLIPAITFVMAVIFGLERLGIDTLSGQAKVLGTLIGVGGAMVLTFYNGADINLWQPKIDLLKSAQRVTPDKESAAGNRVMGSFMIVASCFSYAIWLIIQAKMNKEYPFHYSTTALMCFMATVQSLVYALCLERSWDQWRLGFDIRLLTVIYVGVIASAFSLTVLSWCIRQRGPLYASIFNPLMLVIVALLGVLLLNEKLHVGSIIGGVLIVIGLYVVLWGKRQEAVKVAELQPADETVDVVVVPEKAG